MTPKPAIAALITLIAATSLAIGATKRYLRTIDGKLYDFTTPITSKDSRYFISGRVEQSTTNGTFIRVPNATAELKVSGSQIMQNWTDNRIIGTGTPTPTRRIYVENLTSRIQNEIIAIYALPKGWHTITNNQGTVEHIWKYDYGTPFTGDISQYDTIHILQKNTVVKKPLRPRTPAFNSSKIFRTNAEPAHLAGEQPGEHQKPQ